MNYQNILDRFKEVNVPELSGIKKEIKELSNILQENEIIMYGTRGSYDGGVWLITCTDKRILFLDKGMIKLKQVEIPIDKINSVSFKKKVWCLEKLLFIMDLQVWKLEILIKKL